MSERKTITASNWKRTSVKSSEGLHIHRVWEDGFTKVKNNKNAPIKFYIISVVPLAILFLFHFSLTPSFGPIKIGWSLRILLLIHRSKRESIDLWVRKFETNHLLHKIDHKFTALIKFSVDSRAIDIERKPRPFDDLMMMRWFLSTKLGTYAM